MLAELVYFLIILKKLPNLLSKGYKIKLLLSRKVNLYNMYIYAHKKQF